LTHESVEKIFATSHVDHVLLYYILRLHLAPMALIVITGNGTHDPAVKPGLPVAKYTSTEQLARTAS
ncbi:hypothetical protein BKA61DRAFT_472514, partial [Leptodontidium sp. MPI-SDFR-AT-0119]